MGLNSARKGERWKIAKQFYREPDTRENGERSEAEARCGGRAPEGENPAPDAKLEKRGPLWPVLLAAALGAAAILAAALLWYPPLSQAGYASLSDEPFITTQLEASGLVNVNTATLEELTVLPGIGATRAAAIIEHREAEGPFTAPEDLLVISGIGPKTLENLKDLIEF